MLRALAALAVALPAAAAECGGASSSLAADQCEAWIKLHDATNGADWRHCADLREDPCACSFGGRPFCDEANSTVLNVYLFNNGLAGYLPAEIGAWLDLVSIQLSMNPGLVGAIPRAASSWTKLEELYAYDSGLSGKLSVRRPASVSRRVDAADGPRPGRGGVPVGQAFCDGPHRYRVASTLRIVRARVAEARDLGRRLDEPPRARRLWERFRGGTAAAYTWSPPPRDLQRGPEQLHRTVSGIAVRRRPAVRHPPCRRRESLQLPVARERDGAVPALRRGGMGRRDGRGLRVVAT